MNNALRKKVGGARRRYIDKDYDVDLSYVLSERVIVMSFPASGLATAWRNNHLTVKKFLEERHKGKYHIFNVSEQLYPHARFDGRVGDFNWQDHHAPPFAILFGLVDDMYRWLKADPENVIAIHCNSGKGRAGTACTCLLLYLNYYDNIMECAKLFGSRRFIDNETGVSQPCQVRFCHYFESFLNKMVKSPQIKYLRRITLNRVPNVSNGCKPFFTVYKVNGLINDRKFDSVRDTEQLRQYRPEEGEVEWKIDDDVPLCGSILIKFQNKGMMGDGNLFRISFHTAFIGHSNKMEVPRTQISPEDAQKDYKTFMGSFSVTLHFEDYCKPRQSKSGILIPPCSPVQTELKDICQECLSIKDMHDEVDQWKNVFKILELYEKPTQEQTRNQLCRNKQDEEFVQIAEKYQNLKWAKNDYKITPNLWRIPSKRQQLLKSISKFDDDSLSDYQGQVEEEKQKDESSYKQSFKQQKSRLSNISKQMKLCMIEEAKIKISEQQFDQLPVVDQDELLQQAEQNLNEEYIKETIATKMQSKESLIDSRFSEKIKKSNSVKTPNSNTEDITSNLALHYFNQPYEQKRDSGHDREHVATEEDDYFEQKFQ